MSERTVRLGMMSFAHMHAHSYAGSIAQLPGVELAGIADDDAGRAAAAAATYGTQRYSDYEALLTDSSIDAVIVCSQNQRHRPLVERAAAAGKHILCEKPLAASAEDARAMIEVCRRAGVQLMTAFPCRYSPALLRLREALSAPGAGKILGFVGLNRGRNPGGWFVDRAESGGGATIDHTVHVADLLRWLLGAEPAEVYAEISSGIEGRDFDDVSFLSLRFDNGVFGTLDASWSRPKSFPTWGDVGLSIVTTAGTLKLDMFAQNLVLYSDAAGGAVSWPHWGSSIDLELVRSFTNAVRTGAPVAITGEDGLRALEVALAAYRSADSGRPEPVPQLCAPA